MRRKRNLWKIEKIIGRHSSAPKKTRSISNKNENTRAKKSKNNDKVVNDEITVNIPVQDDFSGKDDNKKNKKKKMNKWLKIILVVLITILIVFIAIFGKYLIKNEGNITQAFKEMVKDAVGDQEPIFILVMGISEDISAELTDTIMLIGYNPDTNQAFVVSIPRDTFVGKDISNGGGNDKINALHQINKKNPEKTIAAVEDITGINIDYYVIVRTSVLVKIVDTLGGVDFDVPVNMDYDDDSQDLHIHLKAGPQKLNGDQAEQLVRFRHNNNNTSYPASYGDNDEGRTRTQREFLKVVAQKVLQTKDVDKIKSIAKDIFGNVETNIKFDQVVGYIPFAIDFKMDELEMQQLPGDMVKTTLWFFKVDSKKTEELMNGYIQKLGLTDSEKKKFLKSTGVKQTKIITNTNTNSTKKNTTDSGDEKKTTTNETKKNTTSEENTTKKNTNTSNTTNTTSKNNNTTEKTNTTNTNTTNSTEKNENNSNKTKDESGENINSSGEGNEKKDDASSGDSSSSNKPSDASESGGKDTSDSSGESSGKSGNESSSGESGSSDSSSASNN